MNEPDTKQLVAERLRQARERAGLSQGQIAKIMDMHRPAISEIEGGRRKVSAEELTTFAAQYGVSVDWLTGTEAKSNVDQNVAIVARQIERLKPGDREKVMDLIKSLSRNKGKNQ